jgi:hypothetical protein
MSTSQKLWVGYRCPGGKATLDLAGFAARVLLLGSRADDIAALSTLSAKEAGLKPIILDLGGALATTLSGYFDTFDYRSFLYDAFRLEPPEAWHSQLVAAAYTAALDLSSEEEAIINSTLQAVASEGSMASPVAINDVMGKVEGFRGFYVDKLKGRIGSLRLFDAVDDQSFGRLAQGNVLIDFHSAPYPQAAELAVALFLAKLLAINHATGSCGCAVVLTEAHRIFRNSPRETHGNRLLTHLLEWPPPIFVASDQQQALNRYVVDACPIRVYSSDAWHMLPGSPDRVLSGTFVLDDRRAGRHEIFISRRVVTKTADYASARAAKYASPELTSAILETVERFPLSTRESVVQYLAPDFLPADVNSELTSLHTRECLIMEPKDSGVGPEIFAFTLSEKGRKLLQELRI